MSNIFDKPFSVPVSNVAYDATTWDGNLDVPTKNAVRDKFESLFSGLPVATAAGTVDAITADYTPDVTLTNLQMVAFVATGANTSTTPTFAPDGGTARTIVKQGGQALVAGDIPGALAVCILEYNLANTRWELLNPAGSSRYEETYIPASAMSPTTTNGAAVGIYEYPTNDIMVEYLAFDGATEEFAMTSFPMNAGWDRSTFKAKFYWSSAAGSTAGDTVEWEIAAGALSDSDAIDAALGTAQVISDVLLADSGADVQVSGATPAITVGGTPALGDLIHFKISRNVGGTDNMTEDAWLFGILLQVKLTNAVAAW